MKSISKYVAEAMGTAVLVLFACGAAVIAGESLGVLGIAFAFGLVIVAMAYTIGPISGCHINPAVSLAMLVNKRIKFPEFVKYVLAQLVGAILGAGLLFLILKIGKMPVTNLGQNSWGDFGFWGAMLIEIILTFVFVITIMMVTGKKGNPNMAGLVIGLTLVLVHILGINLTGTSVNPARSLGPALFVGGEALRQLPVFLIAPLIGGSLAAFVSKKLLKSESLLKN